MTQNQVSITLAKKRKSQRQLIPTDLPVFLQCLRIPAEWKMGRFTDDGPLDKLALLSRLSGKQLSEEDQGSVSVRDTGGAVTSYDPWKKRDEFFRLKQDSTEELLAFLRTVGLFERNGDIVTFGSGENDTFVKVGANKHLSLTYLSTFKLESIWTFRRLVHGSLKNLDKHTGEQAVFDAQIERTPKGARVSITTSTFKDALLLTLSVDRVKKANVQKCARPDCPVTFSFTGGHKRKYCSWDCGHLESVRRQRRKAKGAKSKTTGA